LNAATAPGFFSALPPTAGVAVRDHLLSGIREERKGSVLAEVVQVPERLPMCHRHITKQVQAGELQRNVEHDEVAMRPEPPTNPEAVLDVFDDIHDENQVVVTFGLASVELDRSVPPLDDGDGIGRRIERRDTTVRVRRELLPRRIRYRISTPVQRADPRARQRAVRPSTQNLRHAKAGLRIEYVPSV